MPRLDLAVALGVGVAGALVDVSSYARLTDGLSRRWGRDDAFYGVDPGTFSFVLDNSDGRFTPDNASSPLATKLTEGMAACVSVGGRLTGGTVRTVEPEFPGGVAAWASVRVTCDDLLGELSRRRLSLLADDLVEAAGTFGLWKFADSVTSSVAVDSGPNALSPWVSGAGTRVIEFGTTGLSWVGETQATLGRNGVGAELGCDVSIVPDYAAGTGGCYGFWLTLVAADPLGDQIFSFVMNPVTNAGPNVTIIGTDRRFRFGVSGSLTAGGPTLAVGVPVYVAITVTVNGANVDYSFYVDGVFCATHSTPHGGATSGSDLAPSSFTITAGPTVPGGYVNFSRFSHTRDLVAEYLVRDTGTTSGGLLALDAAVANAQLATLPAGLSSASIVIGDVENESSLDVLNSLMFTEQGDLYTTTTGTLTSPTSQIVVRERTRPETVSYTFDVENELSGAPDFIRDLTNLVSRVTVTSDVGSTIVTDSTLTARAGQASTTETVLLASDIDRRAWGEDRLQRGANTKLRIASVVVDAMTTPTDRSADLLALIPGDRVQFTGLPETILGFDTWDGWFLGASERHDIEAHAFQLHFTPVLPDTAVYDTDRYMADGELLLNGAINSSVTSISVDSTSAVLSTTETPYTIQFDDEQMTVTAVAGASSPQTVTVTRGVNGTTAASHADNAVLVSVPDSLYAF